MLHFTDTVQMLLLCKDLQTKQIYMINIPLDTDLSFQVLD